MKESFGEQHETGLEVSTKEELQSILLDAGVDLSQWGVGKAKTIEHLFKEVEGGEAVLVRKGNQIIRTINPLRIHVFYTAPDGAEYELSEQHQAFLDTGRMRPGRSPGAVGEKMQSDEVLASAVVRALHEELGIAGNVKSIEEKEVIHEKGSSSSYPGITSIKNIYPFEVHLADDQFNPNGYVEVQNDKVTCFNWKQKIG